ncbi:hypothetical protein I317_03781 [Kwoniella heveanensis CBS 569]|uniref:Uncharacterized protein n=1 Tax=Kwoniella heveanensis BCC8398 TaxID=1296120 RepID=A0A1B9GUJ4_9TREE|nr:hypothetical protein I316_03749 [Kwoniella heveanensis BCC8398]OCF42406.1 hypothetical protein I317_03781 [Kwoniella heveanensis CBS 569]
MPHKRAKRSVREAETAKKGKNLAPSAASTKAEYDDTPKSASRILNSWKVQSAFRSSGRINSEDVGGSRPSGSSKNGSTSASASASSFSASENNPKGKTKIPSILPNESLGEYNRRVEQLLRPGVNKAIQEAASTKAAEEAAARKEKKDRKKRTRIEKLVKDGKMPKEALDKLIAEQAAEKNAAAADAKGKGKRKRTGADDDEDGDDGDEGSEDEGLGGAEQKQNRRPAKEFASMPGPRRLNDIVQAPPQLPHLRKSGTQSSASGRSKEAYAAVGNSGRNPLNAGQRRILEEERERVVKLYREMKEKKEVEREKEKVGSKSASRERVRKL